MGLVDYGSDSDSDTEAPSAPAPAPAPASAPKPPTTSLLSSLPPPKSSLSLPPPLSSSSSSSLTLPPPSASKPHPKKKDKGPVRILLDLPPPAASGPTPPTDEPPAKKPKLTLGGSGGGGKLTGLAAMLPAPKNEGPVAPKAAQPAVVKPVLSVPVGMEGLGDLVGAADGEDEGVKEAKAEVGTGAGGMFMPYSMTKGKGKAAVAASAPKQAAPLAPELDFFGLGAVTAAPTPSLPSSSSSTSKPSLSISSAPSLSAAPPTSAASTPSDPYPGFTQLPTGQWVAKDQATYDAWVAQVGGLPQQQEEAPRGFEAHAVAQAVEVDDEARKRQEAWERRPDIMEQREEERKERAAEDKKKMLKIGDRKVAAGRARRTGQLSALLADAVDNRAELEAQIARGKANRKAAGNKYGF